MTNSQLVELSGYYTMAALFALGIGLLSLLQYRVAKLIKPQTKVAVVMVVIGLGALASVALTSRDLNEITPQVGMGALYEDYENGFAASRWLTLFLLGASFVEIIRGWLLARAARQSDPARSLFAAMFAFYGGTLLIQAVLSEHVGFSYKEVYVPMVLVAVYLQPVSDLRPVLTAAKWAVLALMIGSLAGIFVRPDFVMHRPAPGIIPGVNWRLFGLAPHANALGPVALLGIVLELYAPSRSRWLRGLGIVAALVVLVLAQSRTAWIAAALMGLFVWVPRLLESGGPSNLAGRRFGRAVWVLNVCILLVVAAAVGLVALGGGDQLQHSADVSTLNGRAQIWDITLAAWQENPAFGYGPEIWGFARRREFGLFHVGQAHNQFIQTLGEAGLAGLAVLLFYLLTLLVVGVRRFVASRGLVLAMVLLILVRCSTEAPMRSEGLLSWSTFLHVLLVVVASHHLRQPAQQSPEPVPDRSARARRAMHVRHAAQGRADPQVRGSA